MGKAAVKVIPRAKGGSRILSCNFEHETKELSITPSRAVQ
jgi:hypothetical protein